MDSIKNIVVPTDFSDLSKTAIEHAVAWARLDQAAVHAVHAIRFPVMPRATEISVPATVIKGIREGAQRELETLRFELSTIDCSLASADIVETTSPEEAIAEAVESHDADLVVMGTHGYGGLKHAFLGSVTERTVRTSACPVLAVKQGAPGGAAPVGRILLPVDFSKDSDRAAEVAITLASKLAVPLDVLHVVNFAPLYMTHLKPEASDLEHRIEEQATEELKKAAARCDEAKVKVELHTEEGMPSAVIVEAAERLGSDLIVMGTRGRTGLGHVLLGSVTERTLRGAPCSVLTVNTHAH